MIIYRYIFKEYLVHLLAITAVLVLIFVINSLGHIFSKSMGGGMGPSDIMRLVIVNVPMYLKYFLPLTCFLSILVVNANLYNTCQFDVMFACGISRLRLLMVAVFYSVIVAIVVGFISMYLSPRLYSYRHNLFKNIAYDLSINRIIPKTFVSTGDGSILYARKKDRRHNLLNNIFIFKKSNNDIINIVISKAAKFKRTKRLGRSIKFDNGSHYQINLNRLNNKVISFNHSIQKVFMHTDTAMATGAKAASLSLLWARRAKDSHYRSQLQWIIALPISTLLFGVFAAVMSKVEVRSGKVSKLAPALGIYGIYMTLLSLNKTWVKKSMVPSAFSYFWPHCIMLVLLVVMCGFYFGWFRRCK